MLPSLLCLFFHAFDSERAYVDTRAFLGDLLPMATVSASEDPKTSVHYQAMRRWLEAFAAREGFHMQTFGDNAVFELRWGEGAPQLAFVLHGDVVPAPRHEWSMEPFALTERDGKLFGRGSEDDKGPLAAVLAVLKQAKASGAKPRGQVLVIIGMGEEYNWDGMEDYARRLSPKPTHVVSLDSGYPVTANEFGFVAWELAFSAGRGNGALRVDELSGGEFLTQVPGNARLVVSGKDATSVVTRALARWQRPEFSVQHESLAPERVAISISGKAVHSSSADEGHNALWGLAALAQHLPLAPCAETSTLAALARFFDGDHWGEKLGIAYADQDMGKLLVVPTVMRRKEQTLSLAINMRRPRGKSEAEFRAALEGARARLQTALGATVRVVGTPYVGKPHVAQVSPTVPVLLDVYARAQKVKDPKPATIRGGTYARLFPGAVNFGPAFPGEPYLGHAPDEYIRIDALKTTLAMLAEVLTRLAL